MKAVATLALILLLPAIARAHQPGVSLVQIDVREGEVALAAAFHAEELGPFDDDGDGAVDEGEVRAHAAEILAASWERIALEAAGGGCDRAPGEVGVDPLGGVRVQGRFRCAGGAAGGVTVELAYLDALPQDHRVIGEARFGARIEPFSLHPGAPRIELRPDGGGFGHFFALGVEHIFTGFDHLLFLAGLLLVAAGLGEVVRLVTSFTIAHSITLAAAVLGWVDLPTAIVEPLIAASIVVVAIENLVRPAPRGRVGLTFVFGLVHGFGFAGLLRALGLGEGSVATGLLGFNLGVEAGQLAVVLAVAPLLLLARRRPWYARAAVPACSVGIGFMGAWWLAERLVGG